MSKKILLTVCLIAAAVVVFTVMRFRKDVDRDAIPDVSSQAQPLSPSQVDAADAASDESGNTVSADDIPEDVVSESLDEVDLKAVGSGNFEELLTLVLYKKVDNMEDAYRFLGTDPDILRPFFLDRMDSPIELERKSARWVGSCMFPDERWFALCEKALVDPVEDNRIRGLRSLNTLGLSSPELEKSVRNILKSDPSPLMRGVAVQFYQRGFLNHPEWIDDDLSGALAGVIRDHTADQSQSPRMYAAWVLALSDRNTDEVVDALRSAYLNGRDSSGKDLAVALAAASGLARRGQADFDVKQFLLNNLRRELTYDNDSVIASAMVGLANFRDDEEVRRAVVQAVPAHHSDVDQKPINLTYNALIEYAKVAKQDQELATACSSALDALSKGGGGINIVRYRLAATLGNLGAKEGLLTLLKMATEGSPNMDIFRVYMLGELRRSTGQDIPLLPNAYPVDDAGIEKWRTFIEENYK